MGNSISSEFNLQNDYLYKGSYSQSGWEAMIYANLSSGRPLLYSGSNPTSGGHAVVLDGYQSSTGLFHFNFGWGGQGDGYYTVNDSTGMNGFSSDQAVLANITPKKQNIKGEPLNQRPVYKSTVEDTCQDFQQQYVSLQRH